MPMQGAAVSEIRVQFGNALRGCRTRQRLTQEQLAERCGLSQKFVGEIERGLANPTIETVAQIATALGIDIRVLFAAGQEHDQPYRMSKRDLQMVREAADSLESVMQRFPSNAATRYPSRKRKR